MIGELAARLKNSRLRTGLTQEQAGRLVGIKGQTLSIYENGNGLPSLEVFYKLAGNYKVSTDWLLGLNSENTLKVDDLSEENIEMLQKLADKLRLSQQNR